MKYRKKPVVIEAFRTDKEMIIHTLEGDMKASVGDFIITGVNGEQYPCKPDIFEKTYELVESEEAKQPDTSKIENILHGKSAEEQYDFLWWLMQDYGMQFTDTRMAVIEWLRGERNG